MKRIKPTMQCLPKKTVYADRADTDKLIRYAFDKNIKASRIKRLLENISKQDPRFEPDYPLLIEAMTAMGEREKLRVFIDNYDNSGIYPNSSFIHDRDIFLEALVTSLILGKTAVIEKLLSEYLCVDSQFTDIYYWIDGQRPFEYVPLYYIMLTKRYEFVPVYMELLSRKAENGRDSESKEREIHIDVDLIFVSALLYDEREFVTAMLDSGYRPEGEVFAELAAYPEVFDEYRKKYFSYYFPERKRPPKQRDFLSKIFTEDERYSFARLVYEKFGTENADRFFDSIDFPKITSVNASTLINARIRNITPDGSIAFGESCLLRLIDDPLRIVMNMLNISVFIKDNAQAFKGRELIYDIRGYEDMLDLNFLSGLPNSEVKLFLKQRLLFDFGGKCPAFLRSLLSRNDKTLTALAVSKGMITQENLSAVTAHISENHLFIALNEIHKTFFQC